MSATDIFPFLPSFHTLCFTCRHHCHSMRTIENCFWAIFNISRESLQTRGAGHRRTPTARGNEVRRAEERKGRELWQNTTALLVIMAMLGDDFVDNTTLWWWTKNLWKYFYCNASGFRLFFFGSFVSSCIFELRNLFCPSPTFYFDNTVCWDYIFREISRFLYFMCDV